MNTIFNRKSTDSDKLICKNLLVANKLPVHFSQNSFKHFFMGESPLNKISGEIGLEYEKDVSLFRSLGVESTSRGIGVGKNLIKTIEQYGHSRNVIELFLFITTIRYFFENMEYILYSKIKVPKFIVGVSEFSSMCPESSLCMHKIMEGSNG